MYFTKVLWYVLAVLAMAGALMLYVRGRGLPEAYEKYQHGAVELDERASEAAALQQQEAELSKGVEGLSSGPLQMERAIRQNKGLLRENEKGWRIKTKPDE